MKATPKLPKPDESARARWGKLKALADRGVDGEATNAKAKLAELEATYDFSDIRAAHAKDIFATVVERLKPDPEARHLATFAQADADVAQWVQWAVANGLKIETTLRSARDWSSSVHAHVAIGGLKKVSALADKIAAAFLDTWRTFAAVPGITRQDRSIFMRGLYDGMMDDRRDGERLPAQSPKRSTRGKGNRTSSETVLHPYSIALELGRALRIDTPAESLCEMIETRAREALEARAA